MYRILSFIYPYALGKCYELQMPQVCRKMKTDHVVLELWKKYIKFVCGQLQVGNEIGIIRHDRKLGAYPSMGVWHEGFALGIIQTIAMGPWMPLMLVLIAKN